MVRLGHADGSVAGATNTTSHTVRAALHCIGVRAGFKLVSSFFLMALPNANVGHDGALIFADCGVVIEPSAAELAEITKLIDAGKIKPIVSQVLPLTDAAKADAHAATHHTRGKIVLKIADEPKS